MDDFAKALAAIPESLAEQERLRRRVDVHERCVRLTQDEVTAAPYLVWNAFVMLLIELPFDLMSEIQKFASLAFRYDCEVQNGGHFQFFVNTAEDPQRDVPAALEYLSLRAHAELLRNAQMRWRAHYRQLPADVEEFVDSALENEFGDVDDRYHKLRPTISDALQLLLERSQGEFVRVDPAP